jgi:hypothetical protein
MKVAHVIVSKEVQAEIMIVITKALLVIMQPMQRPLAVAASGIALACIAGCTQRSATTGAPPVSAASARTTASGADSIPQSQPIRFVIILDSSDSVKEAERQTIGQGLLPAIRNGIGRGNVQTVILTFDTNVREIGTPVFHKPSEFVSLLERNYIHRPGAQGTYFAPVVQRIQEEARQAEQAHQQLVVLAATDGGFNDLPTVAHLMGQLQQIKCLNLLAMGPLTYERASKQGSYYDVIKRDLAGFEEGRVLVFPNEPKLATDAARILAERISQ